MKSGRTAITGPVEPRIMPVSPRLTSVLVLLGLVPVLVYLADSGELSVVLSALCVFVIAASVFWMLGPHQSPAAGNGNGDGGAGVSG